MAQEVLGGLFGPTESEIRQLIDEKGRADINTLYNNAPSGLRIAGAMGAQSGRMLGGALETLSGYVDPRVEKARKMEMVKQSVLSTGVSPDSDPIEFAKLSAREFARMGLGDEAFGAAMYAKQMQDEAEKFGWEKEAKQGDWRTELEKTRMMVEGQLQSARIHAAASGGGGGSLRPWDQNEYKTLVEMFKNDSAFRERFGSWFPWANNVDEAAASAALMASGMLQRKNVSVMEAFNATRGAFVGGGGGGGGGKYEPSEQEISAAMERNKAVLKGLSNTEARRVTIEGLKKRGVTATPPQAAAPVAPRTGPIDTRDVMDFSLLKGIVAPYTPPTESVPHTGATELPALPDPLKLEEHYAKWKTVNPSGKSGVVKYPDSLKNEMKAFYDKNKWKMSVNERNKFRAYARTKGLVLE